MTSPTDEPSHPLLVAATLFVAFAVPALAAEIVNERFGFQVAIPDGFTPIDTDGNETKLHVFLDRPPSADDPATSISIERLNGLVDPRDRLDPDTIPEQPGVKMSLLERNWQGITLDVMNPVAETDNGSVVAYVIQFPLAGEAVQLTVGGPAARRKEIEEQFDRVVGSFRNTKPLFAGNAAAPQAAEERYPFPWTGVAVFGFMAFVVVAIIGKWIRAAFRKA